MVIDLVGSREMAASEAEVEEEEDGVEKLQRGIKNEDSWYGTTVENII